MTKQLLASGLLALALLPLLSTPYFIFSWVQERLAKKPYPVNVTPRRWATRKFLITLLLILSPAGTVPIAILIILGLYPEVDTRAFRHEILLMAEYMFFGVTVLVFLMILWRMVQYGRKAKRNPADATLSIRTFLMSRWPWFFVGIFAVSDTASLALTLSSADYHRLNPGFGQISATIADTYSASISLLLMIVVLRYLIKRGWISSAD